MHLPHGFLGTRADALMDFVLIVITSTPFIMYYGFRLARQKRFNAHRNLMSILITLLLLVVAAFEADIRLSGGTRAFVRGSPFADSIGLRVFFYIHIAIALSSFSAWIRLALQSWGQYKVNLPGQFSAAHIRQGKLIYVGIVATAVTGALLYVLNFAM